MDAKRSLKVITFIKNPSRQIVVSLILTFLFTLAASNFKNFNGAGQFILQVYHTPIAFAFSMFILTEMADYTWVDWRRHLVSFVVITTSLLRAWMEVPFYSGHAFFITYMFLITRSMTARIIATLVLLDVVWVKLLILHDPTLWGGIVLGIFAWGLCVYCAVQGNPKN